MQREWFIFYSSFLRAIDCLPKENQLKAYQFIVKYGLNGIDPPQDEDPIAYAIFMMAKPQLDANNKRFVNWAKWWAPQGNSNAKKDWENISKQPKTTEKQPKDNQKQPKEKEKEKVKDNVKEKEKVKDNSSNEELKDNKLNKTTSLKKIEEEKKEKSSAKKEKNAEVRERNVSLLELIKQKVESLGLIYKAWEMERISATNICTAKVFGSVATKFWLSPPELAIAVIEASAQDQFRAGKIYNAEMVYKHYEKVINQAKASFQKKQNQIAKVKRV